MQELNNNNQNHEAKKAHNVVSHMQKYEHRIRELEKQKHAVVMTNCRLKEDSNVEMINDNSTLATKIGNAVQDIISKNPCSRCGNKRMKHKVSLHEKL